MFLRQVGLRLTAAASIIASTLALPGPSRADASTATPTPAYALAQIGVTNPNVAYGAGLWGFTADHWTEAPWVTPDNEYLFTDAAGNVGVASYDTTDHSLSIRSYTPGSLGPVANTAYHLDLSAYPDWGGFYAAPDGTFYLAIGQDNLNQSDTLHAVAIQHYNASWTLLGTAYVDGGATQAGIRGIYKPFDAARAAMLLVGNSLVVHMGRTIYDDGHGVHHQANLTFQVDTAAMTAQTFDQIAAGAYATNGGVSYTGHSFDQLLTSYRGALVMLDHGDAYPREVQMGVMAGFPTQRDVTRTWLYNIGGDTGNNYTGVAVGGVTATESGILVLADSIAQPMPAHGFDDDSDHARRNLLLMVADPLTGVSKTVALTSLPSDGDATAYAGRIVKIAPSRYAVLASIRTESGFRTEYYLVDDQGTVLATHEFPDLFFSDSSELTLLGSHLYWAGVGLPTDDSSVAAPAYLFALDVSAPAAPVLEGEQAPTQQPESVTATWMSHSLDVTWAGVAAPSGRTVTGYVVTASLPSVTVSAGKSATSAVVPGLVAGAHYTFSVAATNSQGIGTYFPSIPGKHCQQPPSDWPSETRPGGCPTAGAPGAIQGGGWSEGADSATVTWSPPWDSGNSAITGYRVVATPDVSAVTVGASAPSAAMTGLIDGAGYTVTVTAVNGHGTGPASQPVVPTHPNAPSAPSITKVVAGDRTATVAWRRSTPHGSDIARYVVTASPGGRSVVVPASASSAVVTGLTNGSSYTFRVKAVAANGSSTESAASLGVKPLSRPLAPSKISVMVRGRSFTVTWSAASPNGPPIKIYLVTVNGHRHSYPQTARSARLSVSARGTVTVSVAGVNAHGTGKARTMKFPVR